MTAATALWLPLVTSALLGLVGERLGRALPPAIAVRLLTAAVLVCALATGFVLAVAGFAAVAQVPVVAEVGHWSVAVARRGAPVPLAAGAGCVLVVLVLLAAAVRRSVTAGRDLLVAELVCRRLPPAAAGLVVIDDEVPEAYALPGLRGRIVVSTGMLRALPADERAALLAHEAAHLSHRHHLYVQVAELAAAADPLLRPAARAVATAVEREADEVAAAEVGDRRVTARALARAGLARAAARRRDAPPAAALAATEGLVVERTRALLGEQPPPRRPLAAALAALILLTSTAAGITGHLTEQRFEQAQSDYGTPR